MMGMFPLLFYKYKCNVRNAKHLVNNEIWRRRLKKRNKGDTMRMIYEKI